MDMREKIEQKVDAEIKFKENIFKYFIVNVIIAFISFIFLKSFWLLILVMFFWGIEVIDDFLKAYSFEDIVGYAYR